MKNRILIGILIVIVTGACLVSGEAYGWARCELIGCYTFKECFWPPWWDNWTGHYFCPDKEYKWSLAVAGAVMTLVARIFSISRIHNLEHLIFLL